MRQTALRASVCGASSWLAYSLVEYAFTYLPWLTTPADSYRPPHPGFTAMLFVVYPMAGAAMLGVFGAVAGLASGRVRWLAQASARGLLPAAATASVVAAYVVLLMRNQLGAPFVAYPLSICVGLLMILLVTAFSEVWRSRLRFCANPWSASLLMLGAAYLLWSESAGALAGPGAVPWYVVAVLVSSFLLDRKPHRVTAVPGSGHPEQRWLAWAALAALLLAAAAPFFRQQPIRRPHAYRGPAPPASQPNVVLISLDTVRADHLSLYGYHRNTTPNLRRFAQESVVFNRAIATGSMTLTTHASVFTGLYAIRHGAHYTKQNPGGRPLAERFHTLAEILSERGYATLAVVANPGLLGPHYGLHQGFQYYDARAPVVFLSRARDYLLRQGVRNFITLFTSPARFDVVARRADEINREVFALMDGLGRSRRRFFLFVNYMDAHWPYHPPAPFDRMFPGKRERFALVDFFRLREAVIRGRRKVTAREHRHLLSQYDGGIAYADWQTERLLERLKKLGLYENALIIVMGDHGEAFGERSLVGHGVSVYQNQVHVPLIIKYPKQTEKAVADAPVSLADIFPTVLETLHYEAPANIDGRSLLPGSFRPGPVFSENHPGVHAHWNKNLDCEERALVLGKLKFISSTCGKRELYDVTADPEEANDLYRRGDPASASIEAVLDNWVSERVSWKESLPEADPSVKERLRSLGYLQ